MGDFNIYKVDNDWDEAFKSFTPFVDLESLYSFVDSQFDLYKNQINPPKDCVFRAFRCTPLSKVKVVLLGQDPYPGHGVADGLSFSARLQNKAPASLININKELNLEYESNVPVILDLSYLAMQGVFLYNTSILSKDGEPLFFGNVDLFHRFSQCVIQKIDSSNKGVVFILLGGKAAYYERFIKERLNKDDFFTDRESAILFGVPVNFIEGILVGRTYEKDDSILNEIKELLPDCYICNLDGKVIRE